MPPGDKKIDVIYQFIARNGYEASIEQIARAGGITPKTIFNRYANRENLEKTIQQYWRVLFKKHFLEKAVFCNNPLEKLLLLIYELKIAHARETVFFQRECESESFLFNEDDTSFFMMLYDLMVEGIHSDLFNASQEIGISCKFVIFNTVYLYIEKIGSVEVVYCLLQSLLTDTGLQALQDIDLRKWFE